jgi:hypothetical protein
LECRFLQLGPRRAQWRRNRCAGPRGSGGSDPEDSRGLLVPAARRPSATAGRRRSSSRCGSGFPPTPLWAAGPPLLWDARIARSPSCPGRDGSGRSGGGDRRESLQGLLVAAPLQATALPRCWRRHIRRSILLLALCRDLVTTDSGTAEGGHGQTGLGKARLKARGEVGMRPWP